MDPAYLQLCTQIPDGRFCDCDYWLPKPGSDCATFVSKDSEHAWKPVPVFDALRIEMDAAFPVGYMLMMSQGKWYMSLLESKQRYEGAAPEAMMLSILLQTWKGNDSGTGKV